MGRGTVQQLLRLAHHAPPRPRVLLAWAPLGPGWPALQPAVGSLLEASAGQLTTEAHAQGPVRLSVGYSPLSQAEGGLAKFSSERHPG